MMIWTFGIENIIIGISWVKLNTDAILVKEKKGVGLEFNICDSNGQVRLVVARFKPHCFDVFLAEAWAVQYGLVKAIEAGHCDIIMECNSLGLLTLINSKEIVLFEVGAFIDDIHSFSISVLAQVRFISWKGNKLAYELAKFAL